MNPIALNNAIREQLQLIIPDIAVFSATDTGEREAPYLLVESEALNERIIGNRTWDFELRVHLTANAHDWTQEKFAERFSCVFQRSQERLTPDIINEQARDFHVYSCTLSSITPLEANEDDLSQSLIFRLITQF